MTLHIQKTKDAFVSSEYYLSSMTTLPPRITSLCEAIVFVFCCCQVEHHSDAFANHLNHCKGMGYSID
jgi:hypothetical protein